METVPDKLVIDRLSDYIKRNSPYGFYSPDEDCDRISAERILALFKAMGDELGSPIVFQERLERAWPSVSTCLGSIHS